MTDTTAVNQRQHKLSLPLSSEPSIKVNAVANKSVT